HNEENKSKEADRVDAIGQRGYVFPSRLPGKLPSLPGVEDIANENRNSRPRQNAPKNVSVRQMDQLPAETDDENELNQINDHVTKKLAKIFAAKPGCTKCLLSLKTARGCRFRQMWLSLFFRLNPGKIGPPCGSFGLCSCELF